MNKILVITDAPYAFSGYGNQVDKIMTEMVKRGWDVYAFACNYFPNGKEEKDENGYVVFNGIKTILLEDIWNGPEYLYPSKEKVKKAIDEINPDIVFTLNDFYRVAPYLELGEEFVKKWVHWLPIDNDYDDKYTPQFENKLKNLVFITEFGKKMESPKTPDVEHIDMVYHGINSEEFKPMDKEFVKHINNNTGKFVITTVARHQPRKMVYHTARAVFKFLQNHPDAIWVCKTDPLDSAMRNHPEDERDLISLAAKNRVSSQVVYVNAALPVQQLNDLYNNGDVFITLTGGEGFNIPLAESMMAGVPCIVTASTSGPELLDGGRLGYLVPVKTKKFVGAFNVVYDIADIDYAVNCLEKCYMNWKTKSGELEFLGKECRKFALEHFSLNKIVDRWEAIFKRIMNNKIPIALTTYIGKGTGYSVVAESIIDELYERGYDLYINDLNNGTVEIPNKRVAKLFDKYVEKRNKNEAVDNNIIVWAADIFDSVSAKKKFGWIFGETTKFAMVDVKKINKLDYVIVNSNFNKNKLKESGVTSPIYVIRPCVDEKKFGIKGKEIVRTKPKEGEPFTFLHIGIVQTRKNSDNLLSGYTEEFPDDGKTKFILKSGDYGELSWFYEKYGQRKDIQFIYTTTPLSNEEIYKLYATANCYVNISHGEGIGMPEMEAMLSGLPVIGSNWDSRGTFLDDSVGWMVDVSGWSNAYEDKEEHYGKWAEYDIEDYKKKLRYAYEHQDECIEKGKVARKRILAAFTPDKTVDDLEEMLNDVLEEENSKKTTNYTDEYYQVNKNTGVDSDVNYLINLLYGLEGKVLDIGCGSGELVKKLVDNKINAYGIDSNPLVLNHIDKSIEGRVFIESSIKLSATDKEYGWGLVIDLLNALPNDEIEPTLREISRTCKSAYIRIKYDSRGKEWWENKIQQNGLEIIAQRNNEFVVKERKFNPEPIKETDRFIVGIPTKDRVKSLCRTLESLLDQTISNFDVIIADDSRIDHLIDDIPLQELIAKLNKKGIDVFLFLAHGINQADAHNKILNQAKQRGRKLVFRCDDDVTLEPTHLERLFKEFVKDKECKYAAMGGIIFNPGSPIEKQTVPSNWKELPEFAGKMNPCVLYAQTFKYPEDVEYRDDIQHLYSSYMYRTVLLDKVGGFPVNLSSVAYREETLGLYELYLQGYKMKIVTKAWAMHWHEQSGGCRSIDKDKAMSLYAKDEKKFYESLDALHKKYQTTGQR